MKAAARAVLVASVALVAARGAEAQPYRWVDANGVVHYSDEPPPVAAPSDASQTPPPAPGSSPPTPPPPRAGGASEAHQVEPAPPATVAPSPPVEDEIADIIRLLGFDRDVDLLARQVEWALTSLRLDVDRPEAVWMAIANAHHAQALRAAARQALERRLDRERRPALLAWLRSALARKILEAEKEATSAEGRGELRAFASRLTVAPPAPPRLALVHRLDTAARNTEFGLELHADLRRGLRALVDPSPIADDEEARPLREETARFEMIVTMLFAYRRLSETELAEYVAFEESSLGSWFRTAHREALRASLHAARAAAATALARLAPSGRRQPPAAGR